METKFKVGDIVRVKKDLVAESTYDGCFFPSEMKSYVGKIEKISYVYMNGCGDSRYKVEGDDEWWFSDGMLEPAYKHKVGDSVRIRSDLVDGKQYGNVSFIFTMDKLKGKVFKISSLTEFPSCDSTNIPAYHIDGASEYFTDDMFEDSGDVTVTITRMGNKIIAENTSTGEIGESRCNENDDFDFSFGASLALNRLLYGQDTNPNESKFSKNEKRFFTGRVVVTESNNSGFPVGKIYNVSNGKMDGGGKKPVNLREWGDDESYLVYLPGTAIRLNLLKISE